MKNIFNEISANAKALNDLLLIHENNKLIAKFMGGKMVVSNHFGINLIQMSTGHTYDLKNLKYATSWDWLMPVVKKVLKSLKHSLNGIHNQIDEGEEHNDEHRIKLCLIEERIGWALIRVDIIVLHLLLVDFIKWYNLNK